MCIVLETVLETLDKQEVMLFALLYIMKSLLVLSAYTGSLDKWNRIVRLTAVTYQHPGVVFCDGRLFQTVVQ